MSATMTTPESENFRFSTNEIEPCDKRLQAIADANCAGVGISDDSCSGERHGRGTIDSRDSSMKTWAMTAPGAPGFVPSWSVTMTIPAKPEKQSILRIRDPETLATHGVASECVPSPSQAFCGCSHMNGTSSNSIDLDAIRKVKRGRS
jgi:hypothetical protein